MDRHLQAYDYAVGSLGRDASTYFAIHHVRVLWQVCGSARATSCPHPCQTLKSDVRLASEEVRILVHLVNPSDVSFGTGVITPRWLYVIAAATPAFYGDR
jgi:hypothetical protein